MKQLLFPLCLIAVFSCDQQKPIQSKANQSNSKYEPLLAQFKDIAIDTLQVYSPDNTDDTADLMSGRQIDSVNVMLFPQEFKERYLNSTQGLFAIYKFDIDNNRLGLLARTPSDYVPSSIKLFIFDKAKDSITSYVELAELFGDAGDVLIKQSWLFRDNARSLLALTNETQKYYHSADDRNDTTVDVSDYYSLFNLSKGKIDTLIDHQEKLPVKYKSILEKKTVY
jgi:hypothetical protein